MNDPRFPIDQIRIFDFEEDADDASVRVLSALGYDPTGVGQFLLKTIPEDAREQCLRDVAEHKPINYGRFIHTHPAACWRYYHTTQFATALTRCSRTAREATIPTKGSGRALVIDTAPPDAVERGYGRELE